MSGRIAVGVPGLAVCASFKAIHMWNGLRCVHVCHYCFLGVDPPYDESWPSTIRQNVLTFVPTEVCSPCTLPPRPKRKRCGRTCHICGILGCWLPDGHTSEDDTNPHICYACLHTVDDALQAFSGSIPCGGLEQSRSFDTMMFNECRNRKGFNHAGYHHAATCSPPDASADR